MPRVQELPLLQALCKVGRNVRRLQKVNAP